MSTKSAKLLENVIMCNILNLSYQITSLALQYGIPQVNYVQLIKLCI